MVQELKRKYYMSLKIIICNLKGMERSISRKTSSKRILSSKIQSREKRTSKLHKSRQHTFNGIKIVNQLSLDQICRVPQQQEPQYRGPPKNVQEMAERFRAKLASRGGRGIIGLSRQFKVIYSFILIYSF
jgi:hypothetical protein